MKYMKFLFVFLFFFSFSSFSNDYKTTVEYRHEYRDGSKKQTDRFKVFLDTGENIGFEFDARYGNKDDNAFDSIYLSGSELNVFYYTNINQKTLFLAGNSFDFSPDGVVYVPFVRLNYNFNNSFRINGRYKWKIWDYGMEGESQKKYHSKIQQLDTFLGYKTGSFDFEYELDLFIEMAGGSLPQYNNKRWDYENNLRVVYNLNKNWRPFSEIGDIRESKYTNDRQIRYRVGIKYTW